MSNVHTAVADGDCSMCHSPHSSLNKSLISDGYSENMCLDCHYIEIESAKIVHGPLMEGDCISCHDPHQSDYANALKMTPNELCLSCHDELIKINGREIRSIKENLESGYTIHEVISSGECINCHMAHTADYPDLLVANFPVNQYSNATVETFELCFMCHDSELLTAETTEYGTNFRNGTKNLHFLHINGNRGRNCRLCHDIHGAKYEHLLQESVMFGKWEMPLGLLLTEDGGSCATGCHKRKEYSRLIN
jgi:predicted CXXCH cytochrome family protein